MPRPRPPRSPPVEARTKMSRPPRKKPKAMVEGEALAHPSEKGSNLQYPPLGPTETLSKENIASLGRHRTVGCNRTFSREIPLSLVSRHPH